MCYAAALTSKAWGNVMIGKDARDRQRFFASLDRAKGILIVLIVFAHNTLITQAWPESRAFLYNWHVFAFLLLAMVMPFNSEKPGFLTTRFVRYYVPFVAFFTVTWLATLVLDDNFSAFGERLKEWALAVLIGSAALLDEASGARLFWFLPALMGLVLIRWAIGRAPAAVRQPSLIVVAIAGFAGAGLIPDEIKPWIPFGLPIALYALGPGLVFAWLVDRLLRASHRRSRLWLLMLLCSALCGIVYGFTQVQGTALVLASFDFYDVRSPAALIAHALLALSAATTVVLFAASLGRVRWLEWLGQASLLIYLVHQIVFVGLRFAARRLDAGMTPETMAIPGAATFVATMVISAGIAFVIQSVPALRKLLAPRDWAEWSGTLRSFGRRKGS